MVQYSENLIKRFQEEFNRSYGVFLREDEATLHLRSLSHALFPITIAEQTTGRKSVCHSAHAHLTDARVLSGLPAGDGNVSTS